jgi:hypothetical protein
MTRNDQRHGILRHRLTDVACNLGSRAELFRESAVRSRVTPADAARSRVDLFEERILSAEIELQIAEVDLLALEVALRSVDSSHDVSGWRTGFGIRYPAAQIVLSRLRGARRQHETRDAGIAPRDPAETGRGLEHEKMLSSLIHGIATVSAPADENNPIVAVRPAAVGARPARPWSDR